jgi:2-succinyl-5-enolpyruvyl-6-hydroxy-3-cyclohexene-1-carboxylate synthase
VTPPTLLTEWARLLIGSLREAGLRDVVLSPGSRSTPFTAAALDHPTLTCRVLIDERAAAFFALGHARVTGRPVLLICTSGTAGAHYFPAVVEAAEAAVPLLVLTADRPLELQGAAAPQTIEQIRLYGGHARAFFELGTPDADPGALRAVPRIAAQAFASTLHPLPGPVHLNARARKPLEPRPPATSEDRALRDQIDRLLGRVPRLAPPNATPDADAVDRLAEACRAARRGLVVCGPAPLHGGATPDTVSHLARVTGFPVSAEAASQLRFADPIPGALDALATYVDGPAIGDPGPDLVLQVGRPPTASAWHAALGGGSDLRRYVLASDRWPDPWSTATAVIHGPPDATLRALAERLGTRPVGGDVERARRAWAASLRATDRLARETLDEALGDGFSEGAAVRAVVDAVPAGSILALGNSLPIREVDTFVPPGPRGLAVWAQRGVNGIDGLVAGAAGATAASRRPTTLLLGDVSMAHDLGGLAAVRDLPAPLTVVVLNNGGGRIFERLPIADALAGDDRLEAWLTPPRVDLRAAAAAFGVDYATAADAASVVRGLDALAPTGGLLEVVIPEGGTTAHHQRLRRRLKERLGG